MREGLGDGQVRKLTVVRAAARIGRHPVTIDRAVRAGQLAVEWSWGRRLIDERELDIWAMGRASRRGRGGRNRPPSEGPQR